MTIQGMEATTNFYNEAKAAKARKAEKQETVARVQHVFLHEVAEGKSGREAFLESLKAIDEKYNPECDKLCKSNSIENCTVGNVSSAIVQEVADEAVEMAKKAIEPDDIKKWLDVIAYAVPILEGFIDWILDKVTPKNEPTLASQRVAFAPNENNKHSCVA